MIRMAIQVVLIDEAEDRRDVHEIVRIERAALCAEGLGLSLAEGKEISGGIQRVLAGAQVAEWQEAQRICPECGRRRSLKGRHPILFRTPFGTLRLSSERVRSCLCAEKPKGRSISPLAELLSERVSPELLYLETKFASLVSYGMTVRLMDEVLPLDRPIRPERVRRDLFGLPKRTKPNSRWYRSAWPPSRHRRRTKRRRTALSLLEWTAGAPSATDLATGDGRIILSCPCKFRVHDYGRL
jgi:hypothetical protein